MRIKRQSVFISSCLAFFLGALTSSAADPKPKDSFKDAATGIEFVYVDGGCYRMGSPTSDEERFKDEEPHHEVCVNGFWLGKYEVTQAQWSKLMKENPSKFKGSDLPVENVTWRDAKEFLRAMAAKGGKSFRLPTEAEWEFAAEGGSQSKGFSYAGSNNAELVCWYEGNSGKTTHPVGQKQPNELGIYDMSGNVMEWVQDWYNAFYYGASPKENPPGPDGGQERTLRGGSWRYLAKRSRPENRDSAIPYGYFDDIGFRVAFTQ